MKSIIVADSSIDLFELEGEADFATVPMKILTEGREFRDDEHLNIEELMDAFEHSQKNSSSCPNAYEWYDAFGDADVVYAITISSNLSGSWNAAMQAKHDYEEEYPDRHVYVFDSLAAGGELVMIAERIQKLIGMGLPHEEVDKLVRDYDSHVHLTFYLESLANLSKNGRVSPAIAKVAGLLGIRFVGFANEEGRISQCAIARGEKKALSALVDQILKMGYAGGEVRISHCMNELGANKLKDKIIEAFPSAKDLIKIIPMRGLCSFYAERGGMIVGFETL